MPVSFWSDSTATWSDSTFTWSDSGVESLAAKYEWSPSTGPGDAPSWEDITDCVDSGQITRGRQSEFDRTSAGRMTLELDNRDRTFDPVANTEARPNVRVRATVGTAPDVVYLFDGWVDGLPQEYSAPDAGYVKLTATDGFKLLSRYRLDAIYGPVILADEPDGWWRLADDTPQTTVLADSSGNGNDGSWVGSPRSASSLLPASDESAMSFDGENDIGVVEGSNLSTGPLSVECWIRSSKYGLNVASLVSQAQIVSGGFSPEPAWHLMLDNNSGFPKFRVHSGGSSYNAEGGIDIADGNPHHLVGTFSSDLRVRLFVDGVVVSDVSSMAPTLAINGSGKIRIGAPAMVKGEGASVGFKNFEGDMADVALYSYALDSTEVAAHYAAGATPWANDTTGVRVGRVLTLVGWRTGERDIETGASVLGPALNIDGRSALDHLLDVEQTEQGRFFIAGDGNATFYSRNHEVSETVQAAFVDEEIDEIEFDYSDVNLVNDCTVTREGGLPQRAQDTASIDEFWRASETLTGLLYSTDNEAKAMAEWRVGNMARPVVRPSRLKFKPLINLPDLFPRVLTRELGDRVSITKTLNGTDIEVDALIEGITHTFGPGMRWETSWNLSPQNNGTFGPGSGGPFWRLSYPGASDQIRELSKLDSGNKLKGF